MSFEKETKEFSQDVSTTLQRMSREKINQPIYLRRAIVSGNLGTPVCELRAKLEVIKP